MRELKGLQKALPEVLPLLQCKRLTNYTADDIGGVVSKTLTVQERPPLITISQKPSIGAPAVLPQPADRHQAR